MSPWLLDTYPDGVPFHISFHHSFHCSLVIPFGLLYVALPVHVPAFDIGITTVLPGLIPHQESPKLV
jgi:hypothetical protein